MSRWSDKRIEDLLAAAVEQSVPDVFEEAASAPEYEPIRFEPLPRKKKRRWPGAVLAACLLLAAGLGGWSWFAADTVAEVRVNPAVELTFNRWGRVIEAEALNEDGAALLRELDLDHEDVEDAAEELAEALLEGGWLGEDGTIAVRVRGRSYQRAEEWGRKMVAELALETGARVSLHWKNDTSDWPAPEPGGPSPAPSETPAPQPPSSGVSAPGSGHNSHDRDDDHDYDDHDYDDHDDDDHDPEELCSRHGGTAAQEECEVCEDLCPEHGGIADVDECDVCEKLYGGHN